MLVAVEINWGSEIEKKWFCMLRIHTGKYNWQLLSYVEFFIEECNFLLHVDMFNVIILHRCSMFTL